MKQERGEEVPTIIQRLDDEFRKLSSNPYDYPTVEGLAARLHIDMFTLTHWLETDDKFKQGLEIVKKVYDDDLWPEEERTDAMGTAELTFGIVLVLEETKKRYTL
jgi:hypothetical protein